MLECIIESRSTGRYGYLMENSLTPSLPFHSLLSSSTAPPFALQYFSSQLLHHLHSLLSYSTPTPFTPRFPSQNLHSPIVYIEYGKLYDQIILLSIHNVSMDSYVPYPCVIGYEKLFFT